MRFANNIINRYDPSGMSFLSDWSVAALLLVGTGMFLGAIAGLVNAVALFIIGMLGNVVCGKESALHSWATGFLDNPEELFKFFGNSAANGAIYGGMDGLIASVNPFIALYLTVFGVADGIKKLGETYTQSGDRKCVLGAIGATTVVTFWAGGGFEWLREQWDNFKGSFKETWDNWTNGGTNHTTGDSSDGSTHTPGGADDTADDYHNTGGTDETTEDQYETSTDDQQQQNGNTDETPGTGGIGEHFCSFSEDTPVATEDGETPIGDLELGDKVLAYNEETGELEYQEVTAVWEHYDDVLLLTIDDDTLETTTDHPFYTDEGEWVAAGDLEVGVQVRKSDGTYGEVETIEQTETTQPMFNLTVAEIHTYFVGDGQWLVHNWCEDWYNASGEDIIKVHGPGVPRDDGQGWTAVATYEDGILHQIGLYDGDGLVIGHIDPPDGNLGWHGHEFPPGQPGAGHGRGANHIPIGDGSLDAVVEFLNDRGLVVSSQELQTPP